MHLSQRNVVILLLVASSFLVERIVSRVDFSVSDLIPVVESSYDDEFLDEELSVEGGIPADGPTDVTEADGTTKRYVDGVLHSNHGPAVTYPDGSEEWYQEGLLHRDDGPAITRCNEDGSVRSWAWYDHGVLHRTDGPAYVDDNITVWYFDGLKHRDGDEPALITIDGGMEWWKYGYLNRENNPAVIDDHGNKYWFRDGCLHNILGPAIEKVDGTKEYFWHGEQITIDDFKIRTTSQEQSLETDFYWESAWFVDGRYHREDGPAYADSNGYEAWCIDGFFHRDEGPALTTRNNRYWYNHGDLHRVGGPAVEYADGTKMFYLNGEEYSEEDYWNNVPSTPTTSPDGTITWFAGDVIHRIDGPAIIVPGQYESWYFAGLLHRDSLPAVSHEDGGYEYYDHGFQHRSDGPAYFVNGNSFWFKNGLLHREDGPAIEFSNGEREYWYEGVSLTEEDFKAINDTYQEFLFSIVCINPNSIFPGLSIPQGMLN